jgi:hypothetical protein
MNSFFMTTISFDDIRYTLFTPKNVKRFTRKPFGLFNSLAASLLLGAPAVPSKRLRLRAGQKGHETRAIQGQRTTSIAIGDRVISFCPWTCAGHAAPHVGVARCDPYPNAARNRDHRRDSAFKTHVRAAVSTFDHTRIRSPSASTISIWPLDLGSVSSGAVSNAIVTGRIGRSSFGSAASIPNCRRQVKSWLALRL